LNRREGRRGERRCEAEGEEDMEGGEADRGMVRNVEGERIK
jgi:hypothetical protein